MRLFASKYRNVKKGILAIFLTVALANYEAMGENIQFSIKVNGILRTWDANDPYDYIFRLFINNANHQFLDLSHSNVGLDANGDYYFQWNATSDVNIDKLVLNKKEIDDDLLQNIEFKYQYAKVDASNGGIVDFYADFEKTGNICLDFPPNEEKNIAIEIEDEYSTILSLSCIYEVEESGTAPVFKRKFKNDAAFEFKETQDFCINDTLYVYYEGIAGEDYIKNGFQYLWEYQLKNNIDTTVWFEVARKNYLNIDGSGNINGPSAWFTIPDILSNANKLNLRLKVRKVFRNFLSCTSTTYNNANPDAWSDEIFSTGTIINLYSPAPIIAEFSPATNTFNLYSDREFNDPNSLIRIRHSTYPGADNGTINIDGYLEGTNSINIYLRKNEASSQVYTFKDFNNNLSISFPADADNFLSTEIPKLSDGDYRLILENNIGETTWAGDTLDGGWGGTGCFQEYRVKILEPEQALTATFIPQQITANVGTFNIACLGDDGIIEMGGAGGIGSYSYEIDRLDNDENVIQANILNASNYDGASLDLEDPLLVPGYKYQLNITDQLNPGIWLESIVLDNILSLAPQLSINNISTAYDDGSYNAECDGDDIEVHITVTGGLSDYDIVFDGQSATTNHLAAVDFTISQTAVSKTYDYDITDANGCKVSDQVQLIIPPKPEPTLIKQAITIIDGNEYQVSCVENKDGEITFTKVSLANGPGNEERYTDAIFIDGENHSNETLSFGSATTLTINNLSDQTYRLKYYDDKGCEYDLPDLTLEVTPPSAIDLVNDNRISPTCHRYEDGAFTPAFLNGNGASNAFKYAIDGQSDEFTNLEEISGLAAGDYRLNITDEKDCRSQDNFTIDETPEVSVAGSSIIDTYVDCKGDSNAVLTARGLKGGSSITLASAEWRRGEGGDVFSGDISLSDQPAGTYYLKVFDDLGCFSREQSITVPEGLEVQFQNLSVDPETCLDEDNGSAYFILNTLDPRGRTADLAYQLLDDGYNPIGGSSPYPDWGGEINSLAPGDYYLTAFEDNLNCPSDTIPFHIEAADFNAAIVNVLGQSCSGVADGSVSFALSGGQSPYSTFVISVSGDTIHAPLGLPESVSGLAPGSYDAFASDANGCLLMLGGVTIDAAEPVLLDVTATEFYCESTPGSLLVVPSGGAAPYEVFVEGNGSGSQSDLNALAANTYYIQVIDANGCTVYDTVEILAAEEPLISHTLLDTTYCNLPLASAEISISNYDIADFDFEWNDQDAQTGIVASHLTPGSYEVIVQDKASACQWVHPVDIGQSVEGLSIASLVTDASCNTANGSVQVDVSEGVLPYTFAWPGDAYVADPVSGFADSLASGVYEVEVVDANGCSTLHAFSISDENGPAIFMVDSVAAYCSLPMGRLEYFVQYGQAPYDYSWASGGGSDVSSVNTPFADNIKAGTYFFTVEDSRKCKAVRSAIVVDDQTVEPHLSLVSTSPAACGKPLGSAQVRMSGGLPGYAYLWNDPSSQALELASGLLAGVDYQVVATDAKGCQDSVTVVIDELPDPVLSYVDKTETYCGLAVGEIQVSASGPTPGFTYWLDDAVSFSSGLLNKVSPGWHTVTAEDDNGCFTNPVQVQLLDLPALQVSLSSLKGIDCFDDDNGGVELSLENGVSPYSFLWDGSLSGSDPFNYSLAAGMHDVIATDANGCADSLAFEVPGVAPLALESVVFTSPGCVGLNDGSIKVSVTGGTQPYSYQWSNGMEGDLIVGLGAGAYALLVTDANGCVMDTTIFLEEPMAPAPIGLPDFEIVCTGQQYILDAGTGYLSYYWHNDDDFESQQQKITITEQGYYYLDVVNSQGCPQADTFYLETSSSLLEADFVMTSEARVGDTIVIVDITIPEPVNKSWSYDEGLDFISEEFNTLRLKSNFVGTYEVTLTTSLADCNSMMAKEVRVIGAEEASELPGARKGASNMDKPEIEVFPNPSDGYFTCSIELQHTNMIVVNIYHLQQKEAVYRMVLEGHQNYTLPVDLRGKTKGTYLLKVDSNQGAAGKLLIVK